MTDVQMRVPPEADAGGGGGEGDISGSSKEFASCLSKSTPGSVSSSYSPGGKMQYQQVPSTVMTPTSSMGNSADLCGSCRSRYGLEPMGLVFGAEEEPFPVEKQPRGKHRVMSAIEPTRPSISIRRIGEYDLIKTIGSGSTGKVKLALHRSTGEHLAVKIVPRRALDPSKKPPGKETTESRERRILREAAILNLIEHDNIVKLRDFLITTDYFCMFFEYVEGVQLLDYIIMHGKLKERQARLFFRQILSAVDYCHHNSIVHRDLKIENILVEEKSGNVKLLDFGLSNFYNPSEELRTFCGSLYFAAPELLCGHAYTGPEVDVWSLGVILYVLVTGRVPFDDKNLAALHEKIKACRLTIPEHVSDGCRELLGRMICRDPAMRATMDDVIFHPWVNEGFKAVPAYLPPERMPLDGIDDRIVAFLVSEFDIQYSPSEIRGILRQASQDWASAFQHPVVSLYFLARDKLLQDGLPRPAPIQVDRKERSRSVSYIADGDSSGADLPSPLEAHYKRGGSGRKWSAPDSARVVAIPSQPSQSQQQESDAEPRTSFFSFMRPHRSRSQSMNGQQGQDPADDNHLGIRTVYLKGFFSVTSTTSKSAMAIRHELQQYLMRTGMRYEDRRSYFVCEHRPSYIREGLSPGEQSILGRVLFEVHIVKLALIGMHGIQFKRIQGDITHYKNLCAQLIAAISL